LSFSGHFLVTKKLVTAILVLFFITKKLVTMVLVLFFVTKKLVAAILVLAKDVSPDRGDEFGRLTELPAPISGICMNCLQRVRAFATLSLQFLSLRERKRPSQFNMSSRQEDVLSRILISCLQAPETDTTPRASKHIHTPETMAQ
jgi:hypothetical protein